MGRNDFTSKATSQTSESWDDIDPRRVIYIEVCIGLSVVFVLALFFVALVLWLASTNSRYHSKTPARHERVYLNDPDCGISNMTDIEVKGQFVEGDAAKRMFPWTVVISKETDGKVMSFGTGALITPFHVLTATHLLAAPGTILRVMYGSNLLKLMKPVPVAGVCTISAKASGEEDVMLLLLKTPIRNVSKLCVPSWPPTNSSTSSTRPFFGDAVTLPKAGDEIIVAGFSDVQDSVAVVGGEVPKELVFTKEVVQENEHCRKDTMEFDTRTAFCAKAPGAGICRGDSGASAMLELRGRLVSVGTVSSSRFCGYSIDRFTRLGTFARWLHTSVTNSPSNFRKYRHV